MAGSAAAPAAKCRKALRGSFIMFPQIYPRIGANPKRRQARGLRCAQTIGPPNDTKGDSSSFVSDRGNAGLPAVIRCEIIRRRHRYGERLDPDVRAPP